jgi:hypothetical protein
VEDAVEDAGEQDVGKRGPVGIYRELVQVEMEAVLADETLHLRERLVLLGSLELMLSKRPAARAAGLKNFMALRGLDPGETAERRRAALLERIRQRAEPPSHWPPASKG